jgi:uncharacterized membrane protein
MLPKTLLLGCISKIFLGKVVLLMNVYKLARMSIIGALYAAITIFLAPFSYGPVQVRVAEALTILPFIFPESTVGLFVGCIIANIFSLYGIFDIVFGSLATLVAAYLTSKMPHKILAPLPPVIVNAVVVAFILKYTAGLPLVITMAQVGLGEFIACYLLGLPLLYLLKRYNFDKQDY